MNNCMRLSWYRNSATVGMCADPVLLRVRFIFRGIHEQSTCKVKCVRVRYINLPGWMCGDSLSQVLPISSQKG